MPLARAARCASLPLPLSPQAAVPAAPPWLAERSRLFEELWAAQEKRLRGRLARDPRPIEVSLAGGRKVAAQAWRSTPYAVARQIRCPAVPARGARTAPRGGWAGSPGCLLALPAVAPLERGRVRGPSPWGDCDPVVVAPQVRRWQRPQWPPE